MRPQKITPEIYDWSNATMNLNWGSVIPLQNVNLDQAHKGGPRPQRDNIHHYGHLRERGKHCGRSPLVIMTQGRNE